jgi:2-amino-4-hydroxy-6-hydroxymethyldihydropteridine diphosphokinase
MKLHKVYLLLGSNIGDREQHIHHGVEQIRALAGNIVTISSFYETEPWGVTDQTDYLNAAALIETELTPEKLFHRLKSIEAGEGRTDQKKYAPRTLDIDILFYDDEVIHSDNLEIPHAKLHLRQFTLVPLNEIAGNFRHPVLKKTISELLAECGDELGVRLFSLQQ